MPLSKEKREMRRKMREKAKLKTVKDKLEDVKGLLTDQEVFCSAEVNRYLSEKANKLLSENDIPKIGIKICYEPENIGLTAFTNNRIIKINAAHPAFQGETRKETFQLLCGVLAHELAHVLFTNFTEMRNYLSHLNNGLIYPVMPDLGPAFTGNVKQLKDFLDGEIGIEDDKEPGVTNRALLCNIMQTIWNIVEDGRCEGFFGQYCTKHKTLYSGLLASALDAQTECPPLPVILGKIASGEKLKFEALISIMLHYGRFGEINGYEAKKHKKEEVILAFRKAQPFVDDYLDSYTSTASYTALNSILIVLFPYIKEYAEKLYEKRIEEGAMLETIEDFIRSRLKDILEGGGSPAITTEGESALATTGMERPRFKLKFKERFDLEKLPRGSGDGPSIEIEFDGPSGEPKATSGADTIVDSKPISMPGKGDLIDSSGPSPSEEDFIGLEETSEELPDESGDGDITRESDFLDSLDDPTKGSHGDLDKIEDELVKTREDELKIREEIEDLEDLISLIDFGDIHKGYRHQIIRPAVTMSSQEIFRRLEPTLSKLAKDIARKADFFQEDEDPLEILGKVTGSKFHAERVAKSDYKYFGQEFPIEPAPNVKIMVSVDMSGSMAGTNIDAAMETCLLMYLFCKLMPTVDLAIFGDTEDFSSPFVERIYCFKDFGTEIDGDKYRICTMPAHNLQNNRDGYGLRFCKERLAEQDGDKKLLIRISDGQPAANNYSGYSPAVEADIKGVCKECDSEGIAYIAAAIDNDKERIEALYGGPRHYLDITDLSELPVKLTSLIKRLLR